MKEEAGQAGRQAGIEMEISFRIFRTGRGQRYSASIYLIQIVPLLTIDSSPSTRDLDIEQM